MIDQKIAQILNLPLHKVKNVLKLNSEGATIPFMARYRKEMTGSLDEVEIGDIIQKLNYFTKLEERKIFVLDTIKEQGKLTNDLRSKITNCWDATLLEDIYLPYKKKRKTRAMVAIENGLLPMAQLLFKQSYIDLDFECKKYINKSVKNKEEVLVGAKDIIAEWINEDQSMRQVVRNAFVKYAIIKSKVARGKKEEALKYKDYFDFEERLAKSAAHRILAMRRGEKENLLRISIAPDEEQTLDFLRRKVIKNKSNSANIVEEALVDAYGRLLQPSIETEFRKSSKEIADKESINVFSKNLEQLLLAAPIQPQNILAIDPGFRTGCKVVCLDNKGDLLENTTIYPHPPQSKSYESEQTLGHLIKKHKITAVAIGNGTAGQETYDVLQGMKLTDVENYMVNESGASIYSASEIAREEFPELDLTVRGAISIGRRLLDPLAELVKIDPKSIGVGQYQHDVNQPMLKESLDRSIEKCVNSIGVNLNTASPYLLKHISGLSLNTSKNIVEYRNEVKHINNIKELKKIKGLGAKAFELSAGFLRIRDSKEPLDNTGVHPESYGVTKKMIKDLKTPITELLGNNDKLNNINLSAYTTETTGLPTLKDIIKELKKPGLDPRGKAKPFSFDRSISKTEDLYQGQQLPGIVTNLTNFGAFVDIGIKANGLIHVSQISDTFIKDPSEKLSVGQELLVSVLNVDIERDRIQLTLKF